MGFSEHVAAACLQSLCLKYVRWGKTCATLIAKEEVLEECMRRCEERLKCLTLLFARDACSCLPHLEDKALEDRGG